MKFLEAILALTVTVYCVSFSPPSNEDWNQFKLKYKKQYTSKDEENFRMKIFVDKYQNITEHNQKYEKGLVSFKMGVNRFTDLLSHEVPKGLIKSDKQLLGGTKHVSDNIDTSDSIDWREKGAVTEIKMQGDCGSCWTFSTTGAIEGQHFIKTGKLVSLSEQNLLDCVYKCDDGCGGGYVQEAYGYKPEFIGATISDFKYIENGNEDDLKNALATIGPISVQIATTDSFQNYESGLFDDSECSPDDDADHAVLLVGYGTNDDGEYWILKNSWGTDWGEDGYMNIQRNANRCGFANTATYPII